MTAYVTLCGTCGLPVTSHGRRARQSPSGWVHWGRWEGKRCPGTLTAARPGRELTCGQYLEWLDNPEPAPGV